MFKIFLLLCITLYAEAKIVKETVTSTIKNIIGHAAFNLGYGSLKLKYAKKESSTRLITLVIGSGDAEIYLPKNAHPYLQKNCAPILTTMTNEFDNTYDKNDFKVDDSLRSGSLKILKNGSTG